MGVLKFVVIFVFVTMGIQPEITRAADPYPLSNIMLEGIGNPLQCVGYAQPCGPAYPCCGRCYCSFIASSFKFLCDNPSFSCS
ncbi:unnamed protein product [Amaranthus hypochondriacus]